MTNEKLKSVDLAEMSIANLRDAVDKCNAGAIIHAVAISRHLEYGFYFDKSIDSDKFSELDLKLAGLMGKFRNNCSCNKS